MESDGPLPQHLADHLASGDRRSGVAAMDRIRTLHREGATAEMDSLLDALATLAATSGSEVAVDVLLWAIGYLSIGQGPVRNLLLDDADCDDAIQGVLVSVNRSIGSFEGRSRFRSWVYRIAENEAKQVLRRKGRHAVPSDDEPFQPGGFVVRMSSIVANRDVIRAFIMELEDGLRVPLLRYEYESKSYAEIADELDIAIGTVKSRISRARSMVGEKVRAAAMR